MQVPRTKLGLRKKLLALQNFPRDGDDEEAQGSGASGSEDEGSDEGSDEDSDEGSDEEGESDEGSD